MGYVPKMRPSILSLTLVPLIASVSFASCFQPNPDIVTISCVSNDPGQCPAGQSCISGICAVPDLGEPLADIGNPANDGSPSDLAAVVGCKAGGGSVISDVTACAAVAGFFAADQSAYWAGTMNQETCGNALNNALLYGCGAAGRTGAKLCGALPKVIDLIGGSWSSANGTLAQSANTSSLHGVLCCKSGQKAVACPGAFATGQAAQQCAANWAPCVILP